MIRLIFLFLFTTVVANAQIITHSNEIHPINKQELTLQTTYDHIGNYMMYDGKKFNGNSLYLLKDGFLSIDGHYENSITTLHFYSKSGRLNKKEQFNQVINITFSSDLSNFSFINGDVVTAYNSKKDTFKNFKKTACFSINNNAELFQVDGNTITIDGNFFSSFTSQVMGCRSLNDDFYFFDKNQVYKLTGNKFKTVFNGLEERIFDIYQSNTEEIIVVTKVNATSSIAIRYYTLDNQLLKNEQYNKKEKNEINSHSKISQLGTLSIRDPLNYNIDTVYQAVGNSYNEIQEYSMGFPYLHPGVDLFGVHMQPVYSVKKGYIKAVLTTSGAYHWRVAIANENTADTSLGYLYAHLDEPTIPYMVGDSVEEGDVIGYLVDFPVTGFVHCHFARILDDGAVWTGSWWTKDDPLQYMSNFYDSIPPEFLNAYNNQLFAFRDSSGNYQDKSYVHGEVKIISRQYDKINTTWNCDISSIRYKIRNVSIPFQTVVDTFSYSCHHYNDNYFQGGYYQLVLNTVYSRDDTCRSTGNYVDRIFYHIITNSDGNDTITISDSTNYFNTTMISNGNYWLIATISDAGGNITSDSMLFSVFNATNIIDLKQAENSYSIYPNPATTSLCIEKNSANAVDIKTIEMMEAFGKRIPLTLKNNCVDISKLSSGIYFLCINKSYTYKWVKK